MSNSSSFDDAAHRLYRFDALMSRLMSPAWGVAKHGQGFAFVPTAYINLRKGK